MENRFDYGMPIENVRFEENYNEWSIEERQIYCKKIISEILCTKLDEYIQYNNPIETILKEMKTLFELSLNKLVQDEIYENCNVFKDLLYILKNVYNTK